MVPGSEIKVLITGDLCPLNRIEDLALQNNFQAIFNDYIDVFRNNDLNVTDLECPLTLIKEGRLKTGPHQKANPRCIEILKYAGINLAALANNHIMDYGSKGAEETMNLCHNNGIATTGVGENIAEARKAYEITIRNKKLSILNIADNEFLTATDGSYQANPIVLPTIYYDIVNAKSASDYVILIIHAGNEFYELPSPRTKELYRFLIDSGADAIISNHTHCFSGYEIYKGKPVFYGLGNFIYDWPGKQNTDWNKGYAVKLLLSDSISFELFPLKQGNEIPGVFHLNDQEKSAFLEVLEYRNSIIANDSKLSSAFSEYIHKVTPMYDSFIEPYFGKIYNALRQRHFIPNLLNKRKRLLLLNLTRCEAHRDVLLKILSRDL
ncbi:MAG TPA: CapA family protein [Bacteroidales bacterium]|nr:CapA family protein [Bacteroidales bacterium]